MISLQTSSRSKFCVSLIACMRREFAAQDVPDPDHVPNFVTRKRWSHPQLRVLLTRTATFGLFA
jgi:hypothetical protein